MLPLLLTCALLLACALPSTAVAQGAVAQGAVIQDDVIQDDVTHGAVVFPDSLLLDTPDFTELRIELLTLDAARVAETAWDLAPRLVELDRPDLLADFLVFWDDRCGESEPLVRTRVLAAIWDGAFDESVYDGNIAAHLEAWETREAATLTTGRNDFDAFTSAFADQLLPHQVAGSLAEYFCLEYSWRLDEAAALLAEEQLADTWLRWYRDHPEQARDQALGLDYVADEDDGDGDSGINPDGPTSLMVTVGSWRPLGDVALVGNKVLVGVLLEQRLPGWFLRVPVEVRAGRSKRPYLVAHDGIRDWSDRFDAVYLGLELGRPVVRTGPVTFDLFGGLGYDSVRPFLKRDFVLGTMNANLGLGVRWQRPGRSLVLGLDARREWLGPRNDTQDARDDASDSLSGGAFSLRLGAGFRFGRPTAPGDGTF
jgi:hypothetical protein